MTYDNYYAQQRHFVEKILLIAMAFGGAVVYGPRLFEASLMVKRSA